ncbi:MAG: SCO family protein [Myxococcota bacterium]
MRTFAAIAFVTTLAALPQGGWAQPGGGVMAGGEVNPVHEVPKLDEIGVDENLGGRMPLDLPLTRHDGEQVELGDYFDGERPVLLTFAYYTCPVLCSMVMDATARGIGPVDWTAGEEFRVLTISIDPRDTPEDAAAKREEVLKKYDRSESWDFLVAEPEAIRRATQAAGFRYFYMEDEGQYAHPAVAMFLTPEGKLARYLYGLNYPQNDVRLALLEASKGKAISTTDKVILYCYRYDPDEQGYGLVAYRVMQIGGGLTAVVLGLFLFVLWRRDLRRRSSPPGPRVSQAHG